MDALPRRRFISSDSMGILSDRARSKPIPITIITEYYTMVTSSYNAPQPSGKPTRAVYTSNTVTVKYVNDYASADDPPRSMWLFFEH